MSPKHLRHLVILLKRSSVAHKTIDDVAEKTEKARVRTRQKNCAAGVVGALLLALTAGVAPAQDLPTFRTGAASAAQFPPTMAPLSDERLDWQLQLPGQFLPPMAPLSDQSQILDEYQRLNPSQMPNSSQSPASSQLPVQFRIQSSGLPTNASARPLAQRVLEIPVGFERHPTRNLSLIQGAEPFTLRNTSAGDAQTQLTMALQMNLWHDDDLDNSPRPHAVEGTVAEYTPSLQLNIGSIPAPRNEIGDIPRSRDDVSLASEYYLQLQYLPTIYDRLDAGTSRTLQRFIGEAGRANELLTTAVHFEYDQNLFVTSDNFSPEDIYTLMEVSPIIAYSPSATTSLWAQAFYRRITVDNNLSSRNEYVLDTGVDCETSAKTSVGIGAELGHIIFDDPEIAAQNYQQAYLVWAWKPTAKVTFQTRTGAELREFANRSAPNRTSLVTNTVLNWLPTEQTRMNFGIRVQNQPSVTQNGTQTGTLYQDIRIAADVRHEFGWNLYVSAELSLDHRNYDSGLTQMDVVFRPAIGYHTEVSRLFDSLNIEVYYQFQQRYSTQLNSNFGRNVFGFQSTIYF